MQILIVGSRGMLGTDLMEVFGTGGVVLGLDVDQIDITNPAQCRERIQALRPGVVINAAALTAVDYCESHAEEAFRVNGDGAGNLAVEAAAAGSLLVHYSTDYVFDGLKQGPYQEDDPPAPRSVYGQSKLRGEVLVRAASPDHIIVRTAWLFGRNGKNFIRTVVSAARSGPQLRVVNDQRGSPTWTRDLAACSALLIASGARGTFHVTNGGSCTWYELAVHALEVAEIRDARLAPVTTREYPLPAPRPANSVLANTRLAGAGIPALRPWQEAVREYVREL
jgi:dTDP-4-dehydrorhamnose reductase